MEINFGLLCSIHFCLIFFFPKIEMSLERGFDSLNCGVVQGESSMDADISKSFSCVSKLQLIPQKKKNYNEYLTFVSVTIDQVYIAASNIYNFFILFTSLCEMILNIINHISNI